MGGDSNEPRIRYVARVGRTPPSADQMSRCRNKASGFTRVGVCGRYAIYAWVAVLRRTGANKLGRPKLRRMSKGVRVNNPSGETLVSQGRGKSCKSPGARTHARCRPNCRRFTTNTATLSEISTCLNAPLPPSATLAPKSPVVYQTHRFFGSKHVPLLEGNITTCSSCCQ